MRSAAAALVLAVSAAPAVAGRSPYGWLDDVEVVPERGVELESWVAEHNAWHLDPVDETVSATLVGWSATIGLTDRLELELPVEWGWYEDVGTQLDRWGAEVRWRVFSPDPLEAPPVVPLLRLRASRFVSARHLYRVEPGVVVSAEVGPVRVTADAGVAFDLRHEGDTTVLLRGGIGASVRLHDDLRGGAELATEHGDHTEVNLWTAVGPNLAYTHGRTWLSGALLIGITHTTWAPRINWGIAF